MFKKKKILAKDKRVRRSSDGDETAKSAASTKVDQHVEVLSPIVIEESLTDSSKWSSGFRKNRRLHNIPAPLELPENTQEPRLESDPIIDSNSAILTGDDAFLDTDTAMDSPFGDQGIDGLSAGGDALTRKKADRNVDEYGLPIEGDVDSVMFDDAIDVDIDMSDTEQNLGLVEGLQVPKKPMMVLTVEEQKTTLANHVERLTEEKLEKQAVLEKLMLQLHQKKALVAQLLENFQAMAAE